MVTIRIERDKRTLRAAVKESGAIWRPRQKLGELNWKTVRHLKLQKRVVDNSDPRPSNP